MANVKRWVFTDSYSGAAVPATYTFPRNPKEMTSLYPERSVAGVTTTAGAVLLYEGTVPPKQFTFSGPILEKTHFDALRDWCYNRKRRIVITDHYGRNITCVLTSVEMTPVRRVNYYYSHDYIVTALITGLTEPTVDDMGPI